MNFLIMRRILLTAFVCVSSLLLGQSRDLYSLAKGDYLGFNAVFDKDENLYGYVAMYGYGKSGDKTKKFEYVFLDRNLNPVANKEFEGDITAEDYYGFLDHNNKLLLIPSAVDKYYFGIRRYFDPRTMEVDLKTNSVKHKVYYDYDNGTFIESEPKTELTQYREARKERKDKGFVYFSYVYEVKDGGFLIRDNEDYGSYYKNQKLKRYDKNKKLMWEYRFNEDGTKHKREFINFIDVDDKHLYTLITKKEKKELTFFLQVFDFKTGKIVHTKQLEGLNQNTWNAILRMAEYWRELDNDKKFNDKIVTIGRLYDEKKEDKDYGFVRWIIDKKTFESKVDVLNYTDFKGHLPKIDKEGEVEKGYKLAVRDLFFLEDGSVGLLFEKFKVATNNWANHKTTDMVYAFTDKDFKLKDIKVFEKEKTKINIYADYLFSQYLNKGKDIVFFYRDYKKDNETKEKYWNLFINTLIGGKFNQEVIKISEKDKFFISPYVAKEGYILLREYNEKDKYNQIRLERLNY